MEVTKDTIFKRWMVSLDDAVRKEKPNLSDIHIYVAGRIDRYQQAEEVPHNDDEASRKIRSKVKVYLQEIVKLLPEKIKLPCLTISGEPTALEKAVNDLDATKLRQTIRDIYLSIHPQRERAAETYKNIYDFKYQEGESILAYVTRVVQINERISDVSDEKAGRNAMRTALLIACHEAFRDCNNVILKQTMLSCQPDNLEEYCKTAMKLHETAERNNMITKKPGNGTSAYLSQTPVDNDLTTSHGKGKGGRHADKDKCRFCPPLRPWTKKVNHTHEMCFLNPENKDVYKEEMVKSVLEKKKRYEDNEKEEGKSKRARHA